MFAVIGFVLVVLLGLYMIVAGVGGWIGVGAFGGDFGKSSGFLIFAVIGVVLLVWAGYNSPIHFSVTL